jgi:hypothetical protein
MTDTRVVSTRNLVRQESVQFIRPQTLTLTVIDARPRAKMFVLFGDIDVTDLCTKVGGGDLITDSIGQIVILFEIPSGKFNTGNHEIIVADTNDLASLTITGSVFGSAKATFSANGVIDVFQETTVTITTVERQVSQNLDPLAQSFFTYGVTGGMFLSSIDIFFQTKDDTLPVRCEIRPMVNGYPSSITATNINMISIVSPENVNVSVDSSALTKFVFSPPVYLKEDSDYCFVLRSNSSNYNVFTSRMGEDSLEDGRKIYEQPYIGSIFKSENAITWTAEQFEDIKFTINKAKFATGSNAVLDFAVVVPPNAAYGNQFKTTLGLSTVTYTHLHDHGLEVGSKFHVVTRTDALYANVEFNGIPYTEFNATHTVTEVPSRKSIKFDVTTTATSTGQVLTTGTLTYVSVINQGINYTANDLVSITGGGGTGATATLSVTDGRITSVDITNAGLGYTSNPTILVTSGVGANALLLCSVTAAFTVVVNKPMNGFIPKISLFDNATSKTVCSMSTTLGNYTGGNLVTYTPGSPVDFIPNFPILNTGQNSVIASSYNEDAIMGGTKSSVLSITMSTDNENVSPIFDTNILPIIDVYSNIINNQSGEVITSAVSTGSIDTIVVTNSGTGYTVNPIVTITAPDRLGGVQATATSTRSGTSLATIVVTAVGSGYTSIPLVTITRAPGDTTGTSGAAQAVLTSFNTELLPTGGLASARYITKTVGLQIISTGARLFSVLSSVEGSSVDFYIRTSLSGANVVHEDQYWSRLVCLTDRNRSSYLGQMLEYEFNLATIPSFDTYDLKCVMTATDPTKAPIVSSYRLIVLA